MTARLLVTVVGATGAQGGAVVRALLETNKYKIRGLTRDAISEKAQALKRLSDDIEIVTCDITKKNDIERAFKDSWAVYALTDFWTQPDQPEVEMQQGILMADVAAALEIPYYIFSTAADVQRISDGKLCVPHATQKAKIQDYIIEKYPNMKSIFVRIVFYMQNWTTYAKVSKSDDGVIIFELPIDLKTEFDMVDVNDTGRIVREILDNSEKFVGQIIDVCGDVMRFEDVAKIFTKVTGIPAISKTLGEEEFRARLNWLPKNAQTDLIDMYTWFELYGSYSKENQWKNEQIVTKLNTFEDWLRTTGWKGE